MKTKADRPAIRVAAGRGRPAGRFRAGLARTFIRLVAIALLFSFSGCGRPLAPQDVADRFWRAVSVQSAAKVRRYVRIADQAMLTGDPKILPISEYTLGRIVIDDERATIETRVTLAGDKPVSVSVDTELVQEDGQWRVDYAATVDDISMQSDLAHVIGQIESFGDTLKEGIDKSVEEMKKAVPEIEKQLSRIEDEIKQRMPELRERLEEFSKRIEEALENPPKDSGAEEPREPIAI